MKAQYECIRRVDLIVNPRINQPEPVRSRIRAHKRDLVEEVIDCSGINQSIVIDLSAIEVNEKRCPFIDRAAQIESEHLRAVAGFVRQKRIPRIEDTIAVVEETASMEAVRAGLGQDFDAAEAGAVEFG